MTSFMQRAFSSAKDDMLMGMFQTFGADPVRREGQDMVASFFGRELHFNKGTGMPSFGGKVKITAASAAFNTFTAGSTAYDAYQGYQENGISGVARSLAMNAALNASLVKHAYSITEKAGVMQYTAGRFAASKALSKMGRVGKVAATVGNLGDFMTRAVWGSVLGSTASNMLGGGVLSTPGAMLGASFGARFGPLLTVGAMGAGAVLGGGYLAAKGTGAVLKAGYQHTQMRKQIQTDGDMSSFMTQNAFTMRSRAVSAISKSHLNTRSALGQEASYLSFPSRNYHSMYKRF